MTGVPTPPFSSNQALNSYAVFQGVGKSHLKKKLGPGGLFFLGDILREHLDLYIKYKILNIFFDAPVVLCPSFGSMERLKLRRFIYGAYKQIIGVLKARSQC